MCSRWQELDGSKGGLGCSTSQGTVVVTVTLHNVSSVSLNAASVMRSLIRWIAVLGERLRVWTTYAAANSNRHALASLNSNAPTEQGMSVGEYNGG